MFKQTGSDVLYMEKKSFEKNISICRGIKTAELLQRNKNISILVRPDKYSINIDYIMIKTYNFILKIYIYSDHTVIYKYLIDGDFISENIDYYRYISTNDIHSILKIIYNYI